MQTQDSLREVRPAITVQTSRKVREGQVLKRRVLKSFRGEAVQVPDADRLVHLQFRRYAGCPVCNLHMRSIAKRNDELLAAGVREVVVFHSRAETMLDHQGQLPFAAIADPERKLYAEFGVETMSLWAAMNLRSWRAAFHALTHSDNLRGAMGEGEGYMGLPAEFLVRSDGRVMAAKYGKFVDDHWSIDEILALSARESRGTEKTNAD